MGICNITPDSFSDGGQYFELDSAKARIEQLIGEGADIIDIGGESTRPGSLPISAPEQLRRVLEVARWASSRACVSIDTTNAEVAHACVEAGVHAVNDVSMLADPAIARVAATFDATLILSHARAPQAAMHGDGGWPLTAYRNIVEDVLRDWHKAAAVAASQGVPRHALIMDPGLGFSKASRHSFELLRRLPLLVSSLGPEIPVLVGASHKSFLTLIDRDAAPSQRAGASLVAALHAVRSGARIVRVHDVRATRQAIDLDIALGTLWGAPVDKPQGTRAQPSAATPGRLS